MPRAIKELFTVVDRDSGKYATSISVYMLELYQDDLADLLLPPDKKGGPPVKVGPVVCVCACLACFLMDASVVRRTCQKCQG